MSQTVASSPHAAGVNAEIFKALSHPLRGRILVALSERAASPTDLSSMLEAPLKSVSKHCRVLEEADLAEIVKIDDKRRGQMHWYRATARPILDTDQWEKIPQLVRETGTVAVGHLIIGDMTAAVRAGTFDPLASRTMLRTPLVLDDEAMDETAEATMELLDKLLTIQGRAANRLSARGEKGYKVSSSVLAFRTPEDS